MTQSEPHKIIVRVWHEARFRDVVFNEHTRPILDQLYKDESGAYFNPKPDEWEALYPHVLPDRPKNPHRDWYRME